MSKRPQHIRISNHLLRPLLSPESEGRISKLGGAHELIERQIQKARLSRDYADSPQAFDPRRKRVFGAYDSVYPRYGFSVAARDIVERPHLRGRFSLDF